MTDAVFEEVAGLSPVDFRDPDNRELKRIADRFSRYARDNFKAPIVVQVYADPDAVNQEIKVLRELPVEVIENGDSVED